VAIDGTFIKAVNSRANNFTKAKVEKLIAGVDAAVARYLEQLDAGDGEGREIAAGGGGDGAALEEKIAKIKARKAELEERLAACAESPTGQVSLSDPDAVALCKGGARTVGYNVQAAVDARHHMVASVEVTQDGNDTGQLDAMAQQAKEDLGLAPDAPLKVLADAGYGTGAELAACEGNKTVTYVAIQKTRGEGNGLYNEGDFAGDPGADSYRCPAGQTLRRAADRQVCGTTHHTYQNSAACRGCPLKARCTTGAFRRLEVSEHKPVVDAARARLAGEPGAMRQRAAIAEHPFGTVKDRHGRHDLLCKGLELAGAETAMSFWAYNFTRAANVLGAAGLRDAIVRIVARRKAA
jgi:hypothetical protein